MAKVAKLPTENKSMEYMQVEFEVKQILDEDDGFFRFEGMASTFGNIDLVDDIVEKGAFTESLQNRTPIILWQHFSDEPIGMPEMIMENEDGLFLRARLPIDDTLVKGRVIPQVKVGSIRTMSIGFRIPPGGAEIDADGIRRLKRVDLLEVSLVTFPANPMATVTGFKRVTPFLDLPIADNDRTWDSSEAIARVRQFTDSTESPSAEYRRAFLWFDETAADEFGSYKLPYADVINGRLTAIPRAINNAKARLNQTDIPEADRARVLRNIERYQEAFEKSDEESIVTKEKLSFLDDIREVTVRNLEKALRDSGLFTKNAATKLVSFLNRSDSEEDDNDTLMNEVKAMNEKIHNADINSQLKSMLNKLGE